MLSKSIMKHVMILLFCINNVNAVITPEDIGGKDNAEYLLTKTRDDVYCVDTHVPSTEDGYESYVLDRMLDPAHEDGNHMYIDLSDEEEDCTIHNFHKKVSEHAVLENASPLNEKWLNTFKDVRNVLLDRNTKDVLKRFNKKFQSQIGEMYEAFTALQSLALGDAVRYMSVDCTFGHRLMTSEDSGVYHAEAIVPDDPDKRSLSVCTDHANQYVVPQKPIIYSFAEKRVWSPRDVMPRFELAQDNRFGVVSVCTVQGGKSRNKKKLLIVKQNDISDKNVIHAFDSNMQVQNPNHDTSVTSLTQNDIFLSDRKNIDKYPLVLSDNIYFNTFDKNVDDLMHPDVKHDLSCIAQGHTSDSVVPRTEMDVITDTACIEAKSTWKAVDFSQLLKYYFVIKFVKNINSTHYETVRRPDINSGNVQALCCNNILFCCNNHDVRDIVSHIYNSVQSIGLSTPFCSAFASQPIKPEHSSGTDIGDLQLKVSRLQSECENQVNKIFGTSSVPIYVYLVPFAKGSQDSHFLRITDESA